MPEIGNTRIKRLLRFVILAGVVLSTIGFYFYIKHISEVSEKTSVREGFQEKNSDYEKKYTPSFRLYSAFIDKNYNMNSTDSAKNFSLVRQKIIALIWQTKSIVNSFKCCILQGRNTIVTSESTKTSHCYHKKGLLRASRIECPLVGNVLELIEISLAKRNMNCPNNTRYYVTPTILDSSLKKNKWAMCNKYFYGPGPNARLLVEWFEIHRFLGVDKFTIHHENTVNSPTKKVLQFYRKGGLAEVLPIDAPYKDNANSAESSGDEEAGDPFKNLSRIQLRCAATVAIRRLIDNKTIDSVDSIYTCVQSDASIGKQILTRQLACKNVKSNAWAISIKKLLIQYDLETPDHYLHYTINRHDHYPRYELFNDEQVGLWDCRERHKYYEFSSDIDTDEFILPRVMKENAIKNILAGTFSRRHVGVVAFYTYIHITSWEPTNATYPMLIGKYKTSTEPLIEATKNMYMPSRIKIEEGTIHSLYPKRGFTRIYLDPSKAAIHHFRPCRSAWFQPFAITFFRKGSATPVYATCSTLPRVRTISKNDQDIEKIRKSVEKIYLKLQI